MRVSSLGLAKKREKWAITRRGWLVLVTVLGVGAGLFFMGVHSFLAPRQPIPGEILVVEGWVTDSALEEAATIFGTGNYRRIVTTGGPIMRGSHLSNYESYANLAAQTLRRLGVAEDAIVVVPAKRQRRDRTLASAVAFGEWLDGAGRNFESLDLLTLGTHARRSWLLFERAVGDRVHVGIIATAHPEYDPRRWWAYSAGVKLVVQEFVAYLHAKLFSFDVSL